MPLLKYRCPECGKRFEELVGFSHTQDVRCPECGAQQVSASKFCPGCGQQADPGAKFCPNCGQKLG